MLIIALVTVAVCLACVLLMFHNSRVVLSLDTVRHTSWLGRTRTIPMNSIGIVLFADRFAVNFSLENSQLFVFDENHKRLFRMRGEFWNRHDMLTVCSALATRGVNREILSQPVKPKQVRASYRDAVGFPEAHPFLFILIILGGIVAAGAALVLAFG